MSTRFPPRCQQPDAGKALFNPGELLPECVTVSTLITLLHKERSVCVCVLANTCVHVCIHRQAAIPQDFTCTLHVGQCG